MRRAVAFKRFVDNVRLQIDTEFIRSLDRDVGFALATIDLTKEQCTTWLQEQPEVIRKRRELIGKKERLESAKEKLSSFVRITSLTPG